MVACNSWLLSALLTLGLLANQGWARCVEMEPEAIEKAVAKIAEGEMVEEEEVKPTARASFVGFKILAVTPKTEEDVDMLRKMEEAPDTEGIDFWVTPTAPHVPVTMAVRPDLV